MKKIVISFVKTGAVPSENIPMAPARREKYSSIKNESARDQYAASSAAIYRVSGENALTFRYGENGRPMVDAGFVSPAHTDGMAACAYCDVPVGFDIEKSTRQLSAAMAQRFGSLDNWLALEACVKLTGEGLSGIRNYRRMGDVMLDKNGQPVARVAFFDHENYRAAICCREEFEINIIE